MIRRRPINCVANFAVSARTHSCCWKKRCRGQHAWVGGPDGRFITELMVPLVLRSVRGDSKTATSSPRPFPSFTSADRVRLPGSDWLFAKLYCPRAFEDDLLVGPVAELCLQGNCNGRRQ